MSLRTLKEEDDLSITGWALDAMQTMFIRAKAREIRQRHTKGEAI